MTFLGLTGIGGWGSQVHCLSAWGLPREGGLQLWFTEETAAAPGRKVLPLTALAFYLLIDLRKGLGPGCTRS